MYSKLKKSKIKDWWVAKSNLKMSFVNILSGGPLSEDLLIVGYLGRRREELATSTNRVVKITKDGVITEKGTFYPFKEAHELYLHFLIEVQKENTLIAINWEYANKLCKQTIIADVIRDDKIEEGVTFDFTPSKKYNVMFAGYSKDLSSNIVLTTFARRNVCMALGIPDVVKFDIARSAWELKKKTMKNVRAIQNIFAEKC